MLGYDDLCQTAQVLAGLLIVVDMVVLRTVDEANHIGVLLDGTGLTKVAQLRCLALDTRTRFHAAVQLRERDDRDV